jgi:integrase/recombinase XerC
VDSLGTFIQYLQNEKRYSPHTVEAYASDLMQFEASVGEEGSLLQATHLDIRNWVVQLMEAGITPRSIHRKLSVLKTFYQYAIRTGQLQENPVKKVISPKAQKRKPYYVESTQAPGVWDGFEYPEGFPGLRDKLVMTMLYATGMRRAELLSLRVQDVPPGKMQLTVTGKGNKQRIIPFGEVLDTVLREYLSGRAVQFGLTGTDALILTDKGEPAYPKLIHNIVHRYLSQSSTLPQRSPHVLRHSFATHLSDEGADLNAIKDLLGHASLAATQVYMHNSIEKLRKAYGSAHPRAKKKD